MIETLLTQKNPPCSLWLNLKNPTQEEMDEISSRFRLHHELVYDCLAPGHLPKHEFNNGTTFLILRAYDEQSSPKEDTVQGMTKKVAFFLGDRFIISFQRSDLSYLNEIASEYAKKNDDEVFLQKIMLELLLGAVETYHKPLEEMEILCQDFETAILYDRTKLKWEELFRTKSRLMTIKRILWHTQNAVQKFIPRNETHLPLYQDLRERIDSLDFLAETLSVDLANLLSIQMSLASQSTNEVMKVLTVFSVFFMPLTFVVGVYGMNFHYMPELAWPYGYFFVWGLIVAIVLSIYFWFKRKKWL